MNATRASWERVRPEQALRGRAERVFPVSDTHAVLGTRLLPPYPAGLQRCAFAIGSFWVAEEVFWRIPGVWSTAVGYAGGFTPNPTFEEVCSGRTGHAQAVHVVYDPRQVSYDALLASFWLGHDPTWVMRQGDEVGTAYRSAIFHVTDWQRLLAVRSRAAVQRRLHSTDSAVTTEILALDEFYFAEDYHQQHAARGV